VAAARAREQASIGEVRASEAALLALEPGRLSRLVALAAPVSGRVLRILQQSAATVPAGATLLVIGDPARFEIVADVLSTDAVKIAAGARALIEQRGGDRTLRGKVRLVEPYAFTKCRRSGSRRSA
jgi:HlyD family secretion protein